MDEMFFFVDFWGCRGVYFGAFLRLAAVDVWYTFFVKGFGKKKHVGPVSWLVWQHSLCRG